MEPDFKKNLRAELDYLDLTVKELSAKTGISKRTLDCYLGGRLSMPPADTAVKIARALNVSVEYLVTGENEKPAPAYNPAVRAVIQTVLELSEKDRATALALVKVLRERADGE